MVIRQIFDNEKDTIYDFIKFAFSTAYSSDGTEQDYASSLRKGDSYIPTLELVMEDEGKIIGHIMATELKTSLDVKSVIVGPVCIHSSYRDKGLGRSLVDVVCEKSAELGYDVAFVAGDPKFFSRIGFKPTIEYGIKNLNGLDDKYIQCKVLRKGALDNVSGEFSII